MKTDQANKEPTIDRLTLYPSQAKHFWPLLEDGLNRTGFSGLLCTINKLQDLSEGHLFLELQADLPAPRHPRSLREGAENQLPALGAGLDVGSALMVPRAFSAPFPALAGRKTSDEISENPTTSAASA